MKFMRRMLSFLILLLLLFVAACGGDEGASQESEDVEATEEQEESEEETDEETAEEGDIIKGGDLQFAFNTQPATIDPLLTTATITRDIGRHIFETLVTIDTDYQPVPMLAESWEESDDGLTYTFHLREGVLFHNGEEMTAEDVVASMNRWVEYSSTAQSLIEDAVFEEVDDYTVELHLKEPSVFVLQALGGTLQFPAIMPKEVIEGATESGIEEFIGTAPFKFVEWKQDQYIHLEKFEDYKPVDLPSDGLSGHKEAYVDNIYMNFVTDPNTQLTGIQTGEYHIGYGFDYDMYDQLDSSPDVEAIAPIVGQYGIIFNKFEGIFTDVKMRQVFREALDLETIAMAALNGHYRMSSSYMQLEQVDWASENGSELYDNPDLEAAEQLLEEAGYDGEPIRFITTREYAYMYSSAVIIKEQLEKIGVNIELEVYDWATVLNKRDEPDEWDIFITGFPLTMTPIEQLFFNDSWVDGPKDDKTYELLHAIATAETLEEASELWDELQGHSWEMLPILKISDYTMIMGVRDEIEGFQYADGSVLWNVGFTE